MGQQQPYVSIIVPVYNEIGTLRWMLESLAASGAVEALVSQELSVEIIVADDGSPEDIAAEAESVFNAKFQGVPARVVRSEVRRGVGGIRNFAVRDCAGHILLFMDAQSIPLSSESLLELVSEVDDHDGRLLAGSATVDLDALSMGEVIAGARGRVVAGAALEQVGENKRGLGHGMRYFSPDMVETWMHRRPVSSAYRVMSLMGNCLAVGRESFVSIGSYDEGFPWPWAGVDGDLCLRAWRYGIPVKVVPRAWVSHVSHGTWVPYGGLTWPKKLESRMRVAVKHLHWDDMAVAFDAFRKEDHYAEALMSLLKSDAFEQRRVLAAATTDDGAVVRALSDEFGGPFPSVGRDDGEAARLALATTQVLRGGIVWRFTTSACWTSARRPRRLRAPTPRSLAARSVVRPARC